MASILRVNTLTDASSGNSTPMATINQGTAKSWVHCNQSTPSVDDSFNTASITDISTGLSTIAFTNNMSSVSFSAHYTHHDNLMNSAVGEFLTASYRLDSRTDSATYGDQTNACGTIHGDLA